MSDISSNSSRRLKTVELVDSKLSLSKIPSVIGETIGLKDVSIISESNLKTSFLKAKAPSIISETASDAGSVDFKTSFPKDENVVPNRKVSMIAKNDIYEHLVTLLGRISEACNDTNILLAFIQSVCNQLLRNFLYVDVRPFRIEDIVYNNDSGYIFIDYKYQKKIPKMTISKCVQKVVIIMRDRLLPNIVLSSSRLLNEFIDYFDDKTKELYDITQHNFLYKTYFIGELFKIRQEFHENYGVQDNEEFKGAFYNITGIILDNIDFYLYFDVLIKPYLSTKEKRNGKFIVLQKIMFRKVLQISLCYYSIFFKEIVNNILYEYFCNNKKN